MKILSARTLGHIILTALLLLVLLPSQDAHAQLLRVGAGIKGGLAGAATPGIQGHSNITDDQGRGWNVPDPEFYPMFGLGGAGGLALELRLLDMIGIETGLHYSSISTTGWNDKIDGRTGMRLARVTQTQETSALHVPLILRGNIPLPIARPFLGVGFEFIFQNDSTLEYDVEEDRGSVDMSAIEARNRITTTNYTLLLLTLGMELKFGAIRIPIELRAGYALGFDPDLDERASVQSVEENGTQRQVILYDGVHQGHFGVYTGVIYDFGLF